jgi:hypothetical protein
LPTPSLSRYGTPLAALWYAALENFALRYANAKEQVDVINACARQV